MRHKKDFKRLFKDTFNLIFLEYIFFFHINFKSNNFRYNSKYFTTDILENVFVLISEENNFQ